MVPNWSFERDSLCPNGGSEINFAPPWYSPTGGSPDYYNACVSSYSVGVPSNWGGYQFAKTGVAYAGIYTYIGQTGSVEGKEYIQVKLTNTLIQNRKYCVSFYVNFTNPIFTYNNVAITEIGMYISDTVVSLLPSDESTLPYSPQIKSPSGLFLNDTLDWVEISGTYTAHGGEKYITIGNFNSNTDTIGFVNRNNYSSSYYFIDDVSVVDCTDMGVPQLTDAKDFKLYPNPNDGNMTLEYSIDGKESGLFTIYDVSGRLVKQQSLNPENNLAIITAEELSAGAYYYTVTIADRKVKSDKLIIIK